MLCDSITAIRAGFQRPCCECVAKGMDGRPWKPGAMRETDFLDDVVEAEMDCFRYAESGACQQGEKSVVGVPAKGIPFAQRRGCLENALDFFRGENVGHRSRSALTAKDRGRDFVVWVNAVSASCNSSGRLRKETNT